MVLARKGNILLEIELNPHLRNTKVELADIFRKKEWIFMVTFPCHVGCMWGIVTDNNMIGDFILWLKKVLKQNFFCIHRYVWREYLDFRYEKCEKCCKLK